MFFSAIDLLLRAILRGHPDAQASGTLENAVDVISCVHGLTDDFRSIRDQAAGGNEVSRCEDRTSEREARQAGRAKCRSSKPTQMLASPDQQTSLTDSDCRSIAHERARLGGRQVQCSSRGANRAHLIIAHDVTNSGSDRAHCKHVVHRPSASPTTSGGSGQSSLSQMARSNSASRTVTCWFARMQAAQATTIRRLMTGTD